MGSQVPSFQICLGTEWLLYQINLVFNSPPIMENLDLVLASLTLESSSKWESFLSLQPVGSQASLLNTLKYFHSYRGFRKTSRNCKITQNNKLMKWNFGYLQTCFITEDLFALSSLCSLNK